MCFMKHRQRHRSKSNPSSSSLSNQVRIIGGKHKRRQITFCDINGLRPTPDRLRETLFNWLMYDLFDANVLDACAGSGVLGFESLSRGACQCTFIEANQKQSQQLKETANQLHLTPQAHIMYGKAEEVLSQNNGQPPFNLVFLDPPYALNLWTTILAALVHHQHINAQTLIYLEADKPIDEISLDDFSYEVLKETHIGQIYAYLIRLNL